MCNKCRLSIYKNNSDKDSDCETETDLSPSDATSNDPIFGFEVKSEEAVFWGWGLWNSYPEDSCYS